MTKGLNVVMLRPTLIALAITTTLNAYAATDVVKPSANDLTIAKIKERIKASGATMKADASGTAVIDVMVWYTPREAEMFGDEALHDRAMTYIDTTNQALTNSNINARFEVVGFRETQNVPGFLQAINDYNAHPGRNVIMGAWTGALLNSLVCPINSDGTDNCPTSGMPPSSFENSVYLDSGADDALLIAPFNNAGNLMASGSYKAGEAAIEGEVAAVYDWNTQLTDSHRGNWSIAYTAAHEFGHTLGAQHELANDLKEDPNNQYHDPRAHAYQCNNHHTAVWSTSGDPNDTYLFYSDPQHQEGTDYCGEAGTAENATVMAENAPLAASRRDRPAAVGTVSFATTSIDANENQGDVAITLTRTGDISGTATVQVAVIDQTTQAGQDYQGGVMNVDFAAGQAQATAKLHLIANGGNETDETATLKLRYPVHLSLGAQDTATLTIHDSVSGDSGSVSVTASVPATVNEGQPLTVTLHRTGGSAGEQLYRVMTNAGTANSMDGRYDYTDTLVDFKDGETDKTVTINTHDDGVATGNQAFDVYVVPLADRSHPQAFTVTLNDNQTVTAGDFALSAPGSVGEGDGKVTVTITRSNGTDGQQTLHLATSDGTATAGSDYTAVNQDVVFAAGETQKTVDIAIIDDSVHESNESFTVNLTSATANVTNGNATIIINDNDPAPAASSDSGSGGGGGSFGFYGAFAMLLMGLWRRVKAK